jgi:hypothetical protein
MWVREGIGCGHLARFKPYRLRDPKGKGFERACLRAVSVSYSSERN